MTGVGDQASASEPVSPSPKPSPIKGEGKRGCAAGEAFAARVRGPADTADECFAPTADPEIATAPAWLGDDDGASR